MADEVDITNEREELNIANAIRASRQASGPKPIGLCLWCDESVGPGERWCCIECSVDWQRSDRARQRAGR